MRNKRWKRGQAMTEYIQIIAMVSLTSLAVLYATCDVFCSVCAEHAKLLGGTIPTPKIDSKGNLQTLTEHGW